MSTDTTVVEGEVTDVQDVAEATDSPTLPTLVAEFGRVTAFEAQMKKYIAARRRQLFEQMQQVKKQTGAKSFSYAFGEKQAVTFTIKEPAADVIVGDEDALIEWVMENYPSEVETKFVLREAFLKSLLKRVEHSEDGVFDPKTGGAEVPGLKHKPAGEPTSFNTSWTGGDTAKDAALHELANTNVGGLLGIEAGDNQ